MIERDKGPVVVKVGAPSLHDDLQQVIAVQGRLPAPVVLLIGAAAATVASLPPLWTAGRYLYTIAHEGGHAFMGSVVGLRITGVTMKRNGDGETNAVGPPGFGVFLFQFFGYLAPSALGVGTAKLIQVGHIVAVLWLLLLALAVLLLSARGPVAWACIIGSGFLLYCIARYATLGTKVFTAYAVTWFLLISGVVVVLEHWRTGKDRELLKETTHLPMGLWPPLWLIGSIAALLTGGTLLI
jgi:Peptidase M50B-like